MAHGQTFWAVKKIGMDGDSMWWKRQGTMATNFTPGWVKKLAPECLYSRRSSAERLMAGEGSKYFVVEDGTALLAKIHMGEILFDPEAK